MGGVELPVVQVEEEEEIISIIPIYEVQPDQGLEIQTLIVTKGGVGAGWHALKINDDRGTSSSVTY